MHINDINEYLSVNFYSDKNAIFVHNVIGSLENQNVILINDDYVVPQQLGKAEASACVLFQHPKGLPWLDVAKLVNSAGYSRTAIYEERLDSEAFNSPDYIFLAGKGVYKHTHFIDIDSISLDDLFLELMVYEEKIGRSAFHLLACYQYSISLQRYDYFEIRHLIKNLGEDYGYYFTGRSQVDTVSSKKKFKRITQKDVIIEAMKVSKKPLTKVEIARLLKSKSVNHASYYLDSMVGNGDVVQVDNMLYTIPNKAYECIDIDQYVEAIEKILYKYNKAVEPSIFKLELNALFGKSFSKYFYASIARLYAKERGWFRVYNLYSIKEISFRSLQDVLDKVCDSNYSFRKNLDLIQEFIAIAQESFEIAYANWKAAEQRKITVK